MHYFGRDYKSKEDLPLLFENISAFDLEGALNNALTRLVQPEYEMIKFILNHHKKEEVKKDFLLSYTQNPKLAQFIINQTVSGSLSLKVHDLAGLFNANEGIFFTSDSLKFNMASFEHNDFEKNLNRFNFSAQELHPNKKKINTIDIRDVCTLFNYASYSFKANENYRIILKYYNENIKRHEKNLDIEKSFQILNCAFKNVDFFKIALEENLFDINTPLPTYSKNVRTNVLELACTHASLDIANYLINDIKIDLKQYMTRSDGKDLIHSTLNLINDNTVYLLDLILSNTLYDFNQTFPMSYEADISPNADNSIKNFFKQKTNLQGLIEQRKVWSSVLGIKQEKVDRQYDKIFKIIEKHQINQTMNKEEFNQQTINIKKQKI